MELELGLKIRRTREDVSSSVDFHFSKDPFGPLVLSQESDSRFIIIIHLKGFKKEGIDIDINKDGNRITVRGRKPVEEMVMIRWMAWRKEVEFRVFKKVFRIPDIVDLDKIKGRFDDDDATLTITMPKRVKGVSGFKIEEEEEEEEERVEFGDVSEAREVEEESIEREESDEHFETEIQREEEFGERENQVLEEEEKDKEETEDDNLEKIDQIYEQDKILECIQEEEEEEELADLNKENEDSSLRKVPEIEGRDAHEQTRHEKQELVVEQQAETKNDDFGFRVLEENGDLEPDVLDRKGKSRAMEKVMADDDDDSYGLSTVQEIEESERHNEERKVREMVEQKDEEEIEDHNLNKIHQLDEQDSKILECIEKEEDETTGLQELADSNKDSSLRKLPEIEGRDSHEQTRHEEQVNKVVEKQDSKAETNSDDFGSRAFEEIEEQEPDEQLDRRIIESGATENKTTDDDDDGLRKVQEIEEEAERHNEERKNQEMVERETGGHEKKKIVKMEFKNRDAKEDVDGKMGEESTPNVDRTQAVGEADIAETDTKAEEFESDKLQEDKVHKIHELVEKKTEKGENAKVSKKSEDKSLPKLQKNLVEVKTPKAGNDILKQVHETEVPEVDTLGKKGDEGKEKKIILKMEIKNGDAKEEVDVKMNEGFALNIAETESKSEEFESEKLKSDEVDKIQKLIEKKEKDEENAKVGAQSEDIGEQNFRGQKRDDKQEKMKELVEEQTPEAETNIGKNIVEPVQERCEGKQKIQRPFQEETKEQPEECKEKIMEAGKKTNDADARKVQEIIRQQELDEPAQCEKETTETETKDQESYRPKILGEQEKIQELAAEKTKFSKNGKVKEEEGIAEKKTEFGDDDDDLSRKVQDIEQQDSDEKKGQEEKDMIQELVLEEKVSDGDKEIIAEAETKAENNKSKTFQEIDEQQSHEEDTCPNKFQKLVGREISGRGEVEKEKKRISDSPREAQEIGKKDSDVSEEYRGIYRNEHEEEKKDEADRPEKIAGTIEQELVSMNSQLEQDNDEDGEKTQELVEEKIKDCEEEEDSSEESKANTDDDVVRKVQGIKEQELYKPKGEHVSKTKELVEEKTGDHEKEEEKEISESEIEAECGRLRKVDSSDEQELHEPKIHKESDKTRISEAEEPSGQEKEEEEENDNSIDVQEIKKERPDKPESHEKQYKTQEVVEAGHDDHKEEKVMVKAELETEEESSKKVRGTEQQQYDGQKRSMVQETEKTRATEAKKIVERRTKTKDDSLKNIRDDEDLELSKPYKRQKEDKIQELVEMRTSDYREKVKTQNEADRPGLDEFKRHSEQSKIPQLVEEEKLENIAGLEGNMEDDSSGKFHKFEDLTHEATDPKDRHTVGEGHKEKQQDEKVISKEEMKTEEDSSKKVQEIGKQEFDGLKRSVVQDKMQETEGKGKNIVERKKKTKDGNLRKVRGDQDLEWSKPYKKIPDLDEVERHGEQCNIRQLVGEENMENNAELGGKMKDDSSGKFHEFEEGKSYEDWTYEQRENRKDLFKEEATDLKDRHTGGKGHNDHKEEQEEENIIAKADFEKHTSKKVREIEKEEYDGLKRSMVEDKMGETEERDKTRAMEENEIVARRETTKDGSLRKVREGEGPELGRHKRHGEEDRIQELVEAELSDHREKVKKKYDISRNEETGKLDLGELERRCKQRKIHQSVEDEKGEGEMENIHELGEKMKGDSSGKVHEFRKQKSYEDWIEEESGEIENLVKEKATGSKDKLTGREGEHEEERYEKVAETTTEVEDENNKNAGENKEPESYKNERYEKLDKLGAYDYEKEEENLVDDFTTKIQETEKEESHEKLDIVPDFVEDETEDQEDEEAEEAAAVVASNESESSRKVQKIEEQSEKHKEQNKIPEMQEEDEERVAEKKTEELTAHVQELEGKTENIKGDNGEERRGEKGKQGKTVETMSRERFKKKNGKPMEEKSTAPEVEKDGNEKIAEDEIDSRIEDQEIKGQEPYELLRRGKQDKIPQYHREEEKTMEQREIEEVKRTTDNVSSRKVQQIKAQEQDELEKHGKPGKIPEKHNIQESVKEETKEYREEEMNEGRESKPVVKKKPMASRVSQDIEEMGLDHPKKYAEQELMTEEGGKKEYHMREEEYIKKAKTILQVESKADDDSSEKNETEGLRGEKKKENHQELLETETSDQRKEEKEDEVVEKAQTIDEYVSPRKIHGHQERKSDKMSENFAAEETEQEAVLGEVGTKIGKVKETEEDKKQSFVEKDTSGKAKETKSRDDSSRKKTQENVNQESHEQKSNEEQEKKKLELVEKKTKYCRNEEDANEDKEIQEAEVPRKLKQIEKQELTKIVKRHENQELVEEEMNNQEGENKNSVKDEETAMTETKSKDNESRKIHQIIEQETSEQGRINEFVEDRTHCRDKENLEKAFEDDSSKKIQEIDNDEETESKGNESRKMHQIKEQETSEQGRLNELVESRTHDCRETEFEDGNTKKIQEIAKEESVEPRRDEKREKIQEPVDRETSEDDEEELEIEFENEEEDWEAEVIQEMDSDEENEKIRQIKRIRLGFRLVGGSTLFMSLIVIVISFIRSKRKIRCYKF